jgi:hypothetical protein
MIFLDSRYVDGPLYKAKNARTNKFDITVLRAFPSYQTSFFTYQWVETDRLDVLALKYLGNSELWWQILDINPEILDPLDIAPGTSIRIPNE